jgi:hypothetical protein
MSRGTEAIAHIGCVNPTHDGKDSVLFLPIERNPPRWSSDFVGKVENQHFWHGTCSFCSISAGTGKDSTRGRVREEARRGPEPAPEAGWPRGCSMEVAEDPLHVGDPETNQLRHISPGHHAIGQEIAIQCTKPLVNSNYLI